MSSEFYRRSADDCLRTVLVSVGDQDRAKDLVDEAFARAFASWRTVSRHPAPTAWDPHRAEREHLLVAAPPRGLGA